MIKYLIAILLIVSCLGCDNPYLNPDISKALTEKEQYKQLVEQNKTYERIAVALEKLADK